MVKGHMQDGKFHPHTDYKGLKKNEVVLQLLE